MTLPYRHLAGVALSALAVLLVHAWLLQRWGPGVPPPVRAAKVPTIAWRWVVSTPPVSPPDVAVPPERTAAPARAAARRAAAPVAPSARPVQGAGTGDDGGSGVAALEPLPTPAPEALPLNLELPARRPSPTLMDQVRSDPRIHAAPLSASERFARNLGTDAQFHEERRGEGHWRFRQGKDCFDVRTSRAAQLDPTREAAAATPKSVEPCL